MENDQNNSYYNPSQQLPRTRLERLHDYLTIFILVWSLVTIVGGVVTLGYFVIFGYIILAPVLLIWLPLALVIIPREIRRAIRRPSGQATLRDKIRTAFYIIMIPVGAFIAATTFFAVFSTLTGLGVI